MLSFRAITISVAVLLVAGLAGGWQWPTIVLLVFGYMVLLFWGSYRIDSQFYMPVICQGNSTEKKIAISFDDGPDPVYTSPILDILKAQQVPAVFFCIGHKLSNNAVLVKRAQEEGHVLGNHSFSHAALFDLYSARRMQTELQNVNTALSSIIGRKPRYFRPPYGVTNPNLARAVRKTAMKTIGWNIRSMDTTAKDEDMLLEKVLRSLKPGAILLFHDTLPITAKILPQLIETARELGYEWVRIDALINESPYE